jgi:hypothetical protein
MYRLADGVFIGTVQKSEPTSVTGYHVVMYRTSFEVQRVWKGLITKLETLGTVETFEPGSRYLVFAGSEIDFSSGEASLRTSLECGWAELENRADRKLQWLRDRIGEPKAVGDQSRPVAWLASRSSCE